MNLGRFNFSLPTAEGFHTTIKQPTQPVFFRDPKHDILKPKVQFEKLIVTSTHNNSNLADRFVVSRPKALQPIKATFQPYVKAFKNINKNYHFEPVINIKPPEIVLPEMTETQLSLLTNTNIDPSQKYFLLQSFTTQLELTKTITNEMNYHTPFTNEEKNQLMMALNRLKASYVQLQSQGRLSQQTQNTIVQDYFSTIRPIYIAWKNKNPKSDIDYENALKSGLSNFVSLGDYLNVVTGSRRGSESKSSVTSRRSSVTNTTPIHSQQPSRRSSVTDTGQSSNTTPLVDYIDNVMSKDDITNIYETKYTSEDLPSIADMTEAIKQDSDLLKKASDNYDIYKNIQPENDTDDSGDKDNNSNNTLTDTTDTQNTDNDTIDDSETGLDSKDEGKQEDVQISTMAVYLKDNLKKKLLYNLAKIVYASDNTAFGQDYGGATIDKNNIKNHVLDTNNLSKDTRLNKVLFKLYSSYQSTGTPLDTLVTGEINDQTTPIDAPQEQKQRKTDLEIAIDRFFSKHKDRISAPQYVTMKKKMYSRKRTSNDQTNTDLVDNKTNQTISLAELLDLSKTQTNNIVLNNPGTKLAQFFVDIYNKYTNITGGNIAERITELYKQIGQGKTPTLQGQYKKVKNKKQQLQHLKKLIQSL